MVQFVSFSQIYACFSFSSSSSNDSLNIVAAFTAISAGLSCPHGSMLNMNSFSLFSTVIAPLETFTHALHRWHLFWLSFIIFSLPLTASNTCTGHDCACIWRKPFQ